MFLVLLVGLFGSAMLTNGPAMARQANQASDEVQAQRAAETGAAYVRLQLREDAEWHGNLNTTTIDQPDFKVVEDTGNVIGWLRDQNGSVSLFRIRFNYQDGDTPGGDELSDPGLAINTTFLSVNNVPNNDDKTVPDVNPETFRVDDPTVGVNNAPSGCIFLRIEGLSGPALANMAGPTDSIGPGMLSSRALRAIYGASIQEDIPDAALSAGNGIDLEVAEGALVTSSTGEGQPLVKFRSKKEVAVQDAGNGDQALTFESMIRGELATVEGVNAAVVGDDVEETTENATSDFHNIKWSDVPKASESGSEAVQLPAGIYVGDFSGNYHYYDMDFAAYKALPLDATTGLRGTGAERTALSPNFAEVRTDTLGTGIAKIEPDASANVYAHTLHISKDVKFSETGSGVKDVVFTTPSGRELYEDDPGDYYAGQTALFEFTAVKLEDTIISSPGDLNILIDVEGKNASLTSEGDALVAAPSVKLEVGDGDGQMIEDMDQRLSVYAKGDLTVSTYLHTPPLNLDLGSFGSINIPEMKRYGNLNLQGLLYSWGDATIYGGTPGQAMSSDPLQAYGEFNLAGALVAYGGDPESGLPGSTADTGRIAYHGKKATIDYDKTKLVVDPAALAEEGIPAVTRLSYGFEN